MTCEHGLWMRPRASEERCGVGNGPRSPDRRNGNRSRMSGVAYTIDAGWGRWRNPISKRRGFDSRTDCIEERGGTPAIPQNPSRKPVSTVGMCARPAWPIASTSNYPCHPRMRRGFALWAYSVPPMGVSRTARGAAQNSQRCRPGPRRTRGWHGRKQRRKPATW